MTRTAKENSLSSRVAIAVLIASLLVASLPMLRFSSTSSKLVHHILAIIGTLLMLGAETLYSIRKQGRLKFGKVGRWLQVHIAMGLIGPALVLWHGSFNFYGLAGIVSYLTILVVLSGIFGRYLYRHVPRTLKGQIATASQLEKQKQGLGEQLKLLLEDKPETLKRLVKLKQLSSTGVKIGFVGLAKINFSFYRQRYYLQRRFKRLGSHYYRTYKQIESLVLEQISLQQKIELLSSSKKLLSRWRAFHKPLTITLFVMVGAHILGAIYYGRVL
jgi:hypothetical protein